MKTLTKSSMSNSITYQQAIDAFNEWQRRYIENPEGFSSTWEAIKRTLEETNEDLEVTHGCNCAAYLFSIVSDLNN